MPDSALSFAALSSRPDLLRGILRGIEKEGLRVNAQGQLALTPHPSVLGSALTHAHITTDYSESLLELITGTHASVSALMAELQDVHRFVAQQLDAELIWNQSMPAWLPPEQEIPIAWYGTSNTGMLKHVYRRGLAVRGSRAMQCIAGVHYNFSLPDAFWGLWNKHADATPDHAQQSRGYMALIRNFVRWSWLLMYLFGAAPAVGANFLRHAEHGLERLDDDTWYLPYATSLRMSDLGYRNKTQSELQLCYNDLETFLRRMYQAVTTPWPAYEAMGTHRDGDWIQLNTHILQIENEYYSNIRPKRTVGRCERPVTALAQHGIQYIEVRCLDIDPFSPTGISAQTCHFMDVFLLFCAAQESPFFEDSGFCQESQNNFAVVVKQGREPGLQLKRNGQAISLQDWAHGLLTSMAPYARLLDQAQGGTQYADALAVQHDKVRDPNQTPSAQLLQQLRQSGQTFQQFSLALSQAHRQTLCVPPLDAQTQRRFEQQALESLQAQQTLERNDHIDFATYVRQYHAALQPPG